MGTKLLIIQGTKLTPEIRLTNGELCVTGDSMPVDAFSFYKPLFQYCQDHNPIIIHFEYLYLNTQTTKALIELFETLEALYSSGTEVKVEWHSYDKDIEEIGMDLLDGYLFPWEVK